LTPWRILYHPGVELNVVLQSADQRRETANFSHLQTYSKPSDCAPRPSSSSPAEPTTTATANVGIRRPLEAAGCVVQTTSATSELQAATSFKGQDLVNIVTLKNLANLSLDTDNIQQNEVIQGIRQLLLRAADNDRNLGVLLTQTYELHEYPIPRLFVVLPKTPSFRDKVASPATHQFRLYFLCECGSHTMKNNSRVSHDIHFAKHEGYDLARPTEFFEKYGPYVVAMLQLIKLGFIVLSIAAPALAHLDASDQVEQIQKAIEEGGEGMRTLLGNTINSIQRLTGDTYDEIATVADLEKLEPLKGHELRQLESYLKDHDQKRALGNLTRIVVAGGHVKWVCSDHRGDCQSLSQRRLREVVRLNGGKLSMVGGRVVITISSKTIAKEFYESMLMASGIHELEITMAWAVTFGDLRSFAAALERMNIICLTMDGRYLKKPLSDVLNRGCRFDPIVKLMTNGHTRRLALRMIDKFYVRIGSSPKIHAPMLETLTIDSELPIEDEAAKSGFKIVLECCASLIELKLRSSNRYLLFDLIKGKINLFPRLRKVILDSQKHTIVIDVSQGKVGSTRMTITRLKNLLLDDRKFLEQRDLTRLHLIHTPQESEDDLLKSILHQSPHLSEVHIGCHPGRTLAIIDLITSTRKAIIKTNGSSTLSRLELSEDTDFKDKDIAHITLTFLNGSDAPNITTNITMRATEPVAKSSNLWEVFRKYGSSIQRLETNQSFSDALVELLDSMDKSTVPRLTSLTLDPTMLTNEGLERMCNVIDHPMPPKTGSQQYLGFYLHLQGDDLYHQKMMRLLSRYQEKLCSLTVHNGLTDSGTTESPIVHSSGRYFPELGIFKVTSSCKSKTLSSNYVAWITKMVSAPPQQNPALMAWKSLTVIHLDHLALKPLDWKAVINSIDFSALETLSFNGSNFSLDQLRILVDRVTNNNNSTIILKMLDLRGTELAKLRDSDTLWQLIGAFEKKALDMAIEGL
ncbi:hypothetical protein BGZ54_002896, partial [Gamsiella multidivaricata]